MTNPLLEKFEEIYGEKKEEVVEEKEKRGMDLLKEVVSNAMYNGLRGGMADDIITMGGSTDTISLNPYDTKPVFTINGGSEITGGDYVIPTATVNNGAMSMDGSYISPSTLISSKPVNRAPTCFAFDAPKTEMEKYFLKVLEDVANGRAVVSDIRADVDASFTGFGGQIKYTIGIVGKYP
jgi:hypothetical protein